MAIEHWLVEQPKTIDLETVRSVRVKLAAGAINIIGHDGPGSRVEVTAVSHRPIRIEIDGDTLIIDHPQWSWSEMQAAARTIVRPPEAIVNVLVPRRTDASIQSMNAEALAVGLRERISIQALAGEVFLDDTEGDVTIKTLDGDINVREHAGSLTTRTISGHVTVSGALREFNGQTATGTTSLDITSGLPERLRTSSVSGAATIRLPRDARPAYQVKTVTAIAQLDGLVLQPLHGKTYRTPPSDYASSMSDVLATSFGGQITVLRSDRDSGMERGGAGAEEFRKTLPAGFHDRIDERVSTATTSLADPAEQTTPGKQASGAPQAGSGPEAAGAPRAGSAPHASRAAETTSAPQASDGPEAGKAPQAADAPEAASAPETEAASAPQAADDPQAASAPGAEAASAPGAEAASAPGAEAASAPGAEAASAPQASDTPEAAGADQAKDAPQAADERTEANA